MRKQQADKLTRLAKANELIAFIATVGRRFFAHNGKVSSLEVDHCGHVYFWDSHSRRHIYTHYQYEWRGFTNGGTLRSLIIYLRDFICDAKRLPDGVLGPWPDWYCAGDLWGYGSEMERVRELARSLGIVGEPRGRGWW